MRIRNVAASRSKRCRGEGLYSTGSYVVPNTTHNATGSRLRFTHAGGLPDLFITFLKTSIIRNDFKKRDDA